jgi:YidC/Oxa1 family membrane protein insertase
MTGAVVVLASTLGKIFQPLFQAMAWLIAFFYAVIPNFAIAIALLTVVVMIVTAPLTVKSTKSMVSMQRLSPELKKLQQKYKGDRQKLNEEMMSLYKEHGVNPAGGCLPMLIQFPVFIILYDVIRGLTNTVKHGQVIESLKPHAVVHCAAKICSDPRYIGTGTKLYRNLVHEAGKMPAFGIDLAQKVLGHKSVAAAVPYALLILIAIALQYLQMRQLNSRNPAAAQANPQAQMMQRYMPIIFAVIYINIAAGVNIYFIVSSLCRIGLQEAVFRSGMLDRAKRPTEGRLPGGGGGGGTPRRKGLMERLAEAQQRAVEAQQARQAALQAGTDDASSGNGKAQPGGPQRGGGQGQSRTGDKPGAGGARSRPQQPRARYKRTRKAR